LPIPPGHIIITENQLKTALEESILESGLARKIGKGKYSIDIEISVLNINYHSLEKNSNAEIKYILNKNNIKFKDFEFYSEETVYGKTLLTSVLEKAIQKNFQKFIFELSKLNKL
jgi:hypothetical protein